MLGDGGNERPDGDERWGDAQPRKKGGRKPKAQGLSREVASPFHRTKKDRRRLRTKARTWAAWADKHEQLGDKLDFQTDGMRSLAKRVADPAQMRRKKKGPTKPRKKAGCKARAQS